MLRTFLIYVGTDYETLEVFEDRGSDHDRMAQVFAIRLLTEKCWGSDNGGGRYKSGMRGLLAAGVVMELT